MKYYIGDLHLNCSRFRGETDKPKEEIDQMIKERWNTTVTNADDVYILGDIGKCGNNKDNEYLCEFISTLRGRTKTLITGNHDDLRDARVRNLFTNIYEYREVQDNNKGHNHNLILFHYPIMSWDGAYRGKIHLYGHVHNNFDNDIYQRALKRLRERVSEISFKEKRRMDLPVAINVSCMMPYMDYTPRTLEYLLEHCDYNEAAEVNKNEKS